MVKSILFASLLLTLSCTAVNAQSQNESELSAIHTAPAVETPKPDSKTPKGGLKPGATTVRTEYFLVSYCGNSQRVDVKTIGRTDWGLDQTTGQIGFHTVSGNIGAWKLRDPRCTRGDCVVEAKVTERNFYFVSNGQDSVIVRPSSYTYPKVLIFHCPR